MRATDRPPRASDRVLGGPRVAAIARRRCGCFYTLRILPQARLVALCCEKNRPELGRQITEICDFTSDGYPGHYDGPRAYRLLVHSLTHATERTRQDKAFYETALAMQKADANHLPDHCTVEDFSKRARAYSDTIRPNLPYSVNQMDAALYVVSQLPRGLRESGRRIERDMRRTGNYADLNWVIDECKDVVRDDLKPGAEAKPNIISLLAVPALVCRRHT